MTTETIFPVQHTDEEWRQILSPEQYQVLRGHGTERPGSCALNDEKRAGTFSCAGCGQILGHELAGAQVALKDQILSIFDIVVERSAAEPEDIGDIRHRGRGDAAQVEQLGGAVEQHL